MVCCNNRNLRSVFTAYAHLPFVFVKPGGNWGDHLIYWGAEILAEELGIRWRTVHAKDFDPKDVASQEIVYIHGGGGFNDWCSGLAPLALKKALFAKCKATICGPTTFDNMRGFVKRYFNSLGNYESGKSVYIFARERLSMKLLESFAPSAFLLGIDIDTALHVSAVSFRERAGISRGRYDLLVLRQDNEIPEQIIKNMPGISIDPGEYAKSLEHWLRIHAAARSIVSNRTHSAIAGAVLGVPTAIMEGSYHKNKSIWTYSLKNRGVEWWEYSNLDKFDKLSFRSLVAMLPDKMRESWKIKRMIERIQGIPSS